MLLPNLLCGLGRVEYIVVVADSIGVDEAPDSPLSILYIYPPLYLQLVREASGITTLYVIAAY